MNKYLVCLIKMSLIDIIKQNRPNLSHSSVRTYVSILSNLAKRLKCSELNKECIIHNESKIIDDLSEKPAKNRKTIYSALIVILDDGKGDSKVLNKFRTLMMKDSEKADEEDSQQLKNKKQEDNWMEWDEVLKLY